MTSIYVALIIYLVILFAVGIYYSKKNATISDFLLAGKSLGVIAATLTISASLFGGGLLTGTAQKAYNSGPMMYVYGIFGSGFGSRQKNEGLFKFWHYYRILRDSL